MFKMANIFLLLICTSLRSMKYIELSIFISWESSSLNKNLKPDVLYFLYFYKYVQCKFFEVKVGFVKCKMTESFCPSMDFKSSASHNVNPEYQNLNRMATKVAMFYWGNLKKT